MNTDQASKICNAFGLGVLQNSPIPVSGGLIHRMYKVNTSNGAFAIKELNSNIMKREGIHASYIQSEAISAIVKSKHINAVTALLLNHSSPLYEIDDMIIMVFPWVEGRTLTSEQITPEHAKKIGTMLAGIHTANIKLMDLSIPEVSSIAEEQWHSHINSGLDHQLPWAIAANENLSNLITWSHESREAKQQLREHLIISHRDIDSKNVLWNHNEDPILIDWESAGFINPTAEAISMAIEWSGLTNLVFKPANFSAALKAYCSNCDNLLEKDVYNAIYSLIGGYLDWLEFNMSRSLDSHHVDEKHTALQETIKTLEKLNFLNNSVEKIVNLSQEFSS